MSNTELKALPEALKMLTVVEYCRALKFVREYSKAYRFLREKEEVRLATCEAKIALRAYLENGGTEVDTARRNILKFFRLSPDTMLEV